MKKLSTLICGFLAITGIFYIPLYVSYLFITYMPDYYIGYEFDITLSTWDDGFVSILILVSVLCSLWSIGVLLFNITMLLRSPENEDIYQKKAWDYYGDL